MAQNIYASCWHSGAFTGIWWHSLFRNTLNILHCVGPYYIIYLYTDVKSSIIHVHDVVTVTVLGLIGYDGYFITVGVKCLLHCSKKQGNPPTK